ncbi:MAG TPA: dienelactone hydrolase family protein [Alphaproteobacteria bacterium]|nr:dienelactone hydrolase family protein [Alphaproteobacteria bacterium]
MIARLSSVACTAGMISPAVTLRLAMTMLLAALACQAGAVSLTWPDPGTLPALRGEAVRFPSSSPFTLAEAADPERQSPTMAVATFVAPPGARPARSVPAVVMLHGSGGVLEAREMTYARQLAAMGVAALVIDAFASRRDRATGFTERLLNITETMIMADAYAGLQWLAARPEIDPERVALLGFSYGGMVSLYSAYEQAASAFAPPGLRFAGHAAYYAPCIAQFEDRRTTGKPVLILLGGEDELITPARCLDAAEELRSGGSRAEVVVYPGAYHQWDGGWSSVRRLGRTLDGCRLRVEADGTVRDRNTWLPMVDSFMRKIILGLCSNSDGYLIGRDDAVRARSNADLGRFLAEVLADRRG